MINEKNESFLKMLVPLALFLMLVIYLLASDPTKVGPF